MTQRRLVAPAARALFWLLLLGIAALGVAGISKLGHVRKQRMRVVAIEDSGALLLAPPRGQALRVESRTLVLSPAAVAFLRAQLAPGTLVWVRQSADGQSAPIAAGDVRLPDGPPLELALVRRGLARPR